MRRAETPACGRWARSVLAAVAGLCLAGQLQAQAESAVFNEYEIKAVFLFNFAQFVQWPADVFPTRETPVLIGVLGKDPFGPVLDQTVRGEFIDGRQIVIKRSRRIEDLTACQLLFICKSEAARMAPLLSVADGKGVLTVGEMEGFSAKGGVINFYLDGNKVRFEINPSAARRKGLKLSSQLLRLGKIVD